MKEKLFSIFPLWRKYKILLNLNLTIILVLSLTFNLSAAGFGEKKSNPIDNPQQVKVSGIVTDATTGEALPGVNVVAAGTTVGTITDASGKYSLEVPNASVSLQFSFIGYVTQEVAVGGQATLNVALTSNVAQLSEVVVVGYGIQKRTSMTASVSSIQVKEIASTPIANLSQGLGGHTSGIIFKQGNGAPGDDAANIYIRGISSTGSSTPLIVIDGIARTDYQSLNPNSIESVTVLKDAAAVAPFGVAGANGVLLITTKRGTGAPSLTYNGYIGFQNPTVLPDYVNGYEYAMLKNAAALNDGLSIPYSEAALKAFQDGSDPDRYPPTTDTYDRVLTRNAVIHNHSIAINGHAEKVNYYASLGYQYQGGMWPTLNDQKYNLIINLDVEATKTTKISLNINGRNEKYTIPPVGSSRLFELIGWVHPGIGPLVFSNGMSGSYLMGAMFNGGHYNTNTNSLYSSLSIEQKLSFIPGLTFKGTIAYDPSFKMIKVWMLPNHMASIDVSKTPYVITDGIFGQVLPSLSQTFNQSQQLTYQAGLNYGLTLGKNTIGALAVFEAKANDAMSLGASRKNYSLVIDEINMGSSNLSDATTNGLSTASRQVGLVYRVTYDYASKYLFEASGRYDGSYYFAPGKQWGFFPAFSAGWRLSEENFMKQNLPWINNLKIKGSYGEVGALAGSAFQYLTTYSILSPAYVFNMAGVQGVREKAEPNPNITWERAKKTDIGLEATLWNRLLNIEADYFYEKRSNMLVAPDVIVSSEYGISLSQVNAGIMENQGVEFSASSFYKISKDFEISLSGNITYAKNTLLRVFESDATYNNPNRRLTGRSLGTQFGYYALGFFQVSDFNEDGTLKAGIATQPWGTVHPGDIRYKDISGPDGEPDGKISVDDLTAIGDAVAAPRIVYGISPHIGYKGFTLDMLFQGVAKTNFYASNGAVWPFWNGMNAYKKNLDYWTPENPNALNPRITTSTTSNNTQTSSFWLQDASYLRLKSATLAYSIPSVITQKIGIQNARVYISGQNILTWTKMVDFDPEILPTAGGWSPNSGWNYPQQKVISIGLNVTL